MAAINITGAQTTATWDATVNDYTFIGNTTILTANTITVTTGVTNKPLRRGGAYTFLTAGTGAFTCVASAASRIQIQPSGAASTWGAPANCYLGGYSVTAGVWTLQYVDVWHWGVITGTTGADSWQNVTFFYCTEWGFISAHIAGNGQVLNNLTFYYTAFSRQTAYGASGTLTMSNFKLIGSAFSSGTAYILTNVLTVESHVWGHPLNGSSVTRIFKPLADDATAATFWCIGTTNTPNTWTFDELYIQNGDTIFYNYGSGRPVLSNGVAMKKGGTYDIAHGFATSGMDLIGGNGNCVEGGTTADDFMASGSSSFMGIAVNRGGVVDDVSGSPAQRDFAKAVYNVDNDSGNKTSTHAPVMYSAMDANRPASPPLVPHKPPTWSGESVSVAGGNVTIAGTSGIKGMSCVEYSETSGGPVVLQTPWKYDGFLDPWRANDFTLPVTAHTHVTPENLLQPGKTYFARLRGKDPIQREFWGSYQQVDTTPAAAGGGGAWVF